jgi:predicted metal-binding membrane protein
MATPTAAANNFAWRPLGQPQTVLVAVLALATLMACVGLIWWGDTPLARLLTREAVVATWARHLLFVVDWTLMCTAMMLPTALPLLTSVQRVCSGRRDAGRLIVLCAFAFLALWAFSGVLVRALHEALVWNWLNGAWARQNASLLAGACLVAGGGYLLLPLAKHCVTACRTPFGFVARYWTGQADVTRQALRMGAAYGASCLGCCWPLMAAMSLFGLSDPTWMLAAAVVMAVQKQHAVGLHLTRGLGVVMVLAGLGLATGQLDAQYAAPAWSPGYWAACITP